MFRLGTFQEGSSMALQITVGPPRLAVNPSVAGATFRSSDHRFASAKLWIALVGLIGSSLLFGCSQREPREYIRPSRDALQAFTIDLPPGCGMTGGRRQQDLASIQVNCGAVPEVEIHAGNAESTDLDSYQGNDGFALRSDIPGRSVIVDVKDPDEKTRGYVLQTQYRWPSWLHVWIDKNHEDDTLARRIAVSIRPSKPGQS